VTAETALIERRTALNLQLAHYRKFRLFANKKRGRTTPQTKAEFTAQAGFHSHSAETKQ